MPVSLLVLSGLLVVLVVSLSIIHRKSLFQSIKNLLPKKVNNDLKVSELKTYIISLENNLEHIRTIYDLMLAKLKDLRKMNGGLHLRLRKRKELCHAINIKRRQLKKEKILLQESMARKTKALQELNSETPGVPSPTGTIGPGGQEKTGFLKRLKSLESQLHQIEALQKTQTKDADHSKAEEENLKEKIRILEETTQTQHIIIEEYKKNDQQKQGVASHTRPTIDTIAYPRTTIKSHIAELLVQDRIITGAIHQEAADFQKSNDITTIQYLLTHNHISENQLAHWLNSRFKIPYVPLTGYAISKETINLVPVDIAQRYWIMPIEKAAHILIVAMVDPLDTDAIATLEEITGCSVQVYLGLLSEVVTAVERHYKVTLQKQSHEGANPFLTDTAAYHGAERRRWLRMNLKLEINFAENGRIKKATTTDVSRGGFSFESKNTLPIGSLLTLNIELPRQWSPLPISAVVEVVRANPSKHNTFTVGVKTLKIPNQELNTIMRYATCAHIEEYNLLNAASRN